MATESTQVPLDPPSRYTTLVRQIDIGRRQTGDRQKHPVENESFRTLSFHEPFCNKNGPEFVQTWSEIGPQSTPEAVDEAIALNKIRRSRI